MCIQVSMLVESLQILMGLSQRCWDAQWISFLTCYNKHKLFLQSGRASKIFLLLRIIKQQCFHGSVCMYAWEKEAFGVVIASWKKHQGMRSEQKANLCCVNPMPATSVFCGIVWTRNTANTGNRASSSWTHVERGYSTQDYAWFNHSGCKGFKSTRDSIKYHER